jgi:hypothetical protein
MHNYKQAYGAHGVFGEFNEVAKKSRMSDKNVANFLTYELSFLKLMFFSQFVNLHFSLAQIPICNNTFILVDPSF